VGSVFADCCYKIKCCCFRIINIDKGSLILELIVNFLAPVAVNIVSSIIIDTLKNKKENNITLNINNSDEKEVIINIHVNN